MILKSILDNTRITDSTKGSFEATNKEMIRLKKHRKILPKHEDACDNL